MVSSVVIKGWLTGIACPGASQETRNFLFHRQGPNCPQCNAAQCSAGAASSVLLLIYSDFSHLNQRFCSLFLRLDNFHNVRAICRVDAQAPQVWAQ